MELVSAIIITYKRPIEILERAIRSVLNQTYSNIELIIVNDAPEEAQLEREIEQLINSVDDKRIKYILHEKNMGANQARNTGLSHATGKYVAFLDDDDEWLPNKISEQINAASTEDNVGIVYCGFYLKGNNSLRYRHVVLPEKPFEKLLETNYIGTTSFPLLLKEAINKTGGLDIKQKSCQEYELWIRIMAKYKAVGIDKALGIYYISEDSTFRGHNENFIAGDEAILRKHRALFETYPKAYSNHLLGMFINLMRDREYKLAFNYKIRAFKVCWNNINNITLFLYNHRKLEAPYIEEVSKIE